jgi:hypothetical protein
MWQVAWQDFQQLVVWGETFFPDSLSSHCNGHCKPLPHTVPVALMLCSVALHLPHICLWCMCHQQQLPGCGCNLPTFTAQSIAPTSSTPCLISPRCSARLVVRVSSPHLAQAAAVCRLLLVLLQSAVVSGLWRTGQGVTFLLHPLTLGSLGQWCGLIVAGVTVVWVT